MPRPPAAVVPPSLSESDRPSTSLSAGLLCLALLLVAVARADEPGDSRQLFVADFELQSTEQFRETLRRAEQLMIKGVAPQDGQARVTFVLHGPVIRDLLRENYLENKELVDLAASLSALDVIEIKACQTWMGSHRVDEAHLQPFVGTVPYGAAEVERLVREEDYIDF